ncbi:rhodanese-like domain-containing protein [Synechococcus sp. GFB01]|uniref:rhodanese-like domain-containing protein n=1 Tax=Synechococcus sp. GFB01 TaxID=1662190 RepID=UPI00064EDC15|nr:rhodanese-like domain-containing protein [Synechococcus sp. GFB01]KMM17436.1 sulfurtransferase [Synechococcus sp. GFB01]
MGTPIPIHPRELQQRLEQGEPIQLVDVREHAELELAQLPHAVLHLPLSRSQEWLADLERLLDRHRPIAVLCHAGIRSLQFGTWLIEQRGCDQVWNLEGGIDAWSLEVDPAVPRY